MKKLLSSLLIIMSLSASAGEIIVYDISVHELGYAEMKGKFDFNQESRRAWVTISFTPSYTDDSVIYDERAKVKGLSLNNELNKVVLETDSTPIVCATLKKNFFGTFLKETGKCTFKNISYSYKHDNGYEIETIHRKKLVLKY